ncbi:CO dehydrogenase/acetyl-CoA synthase complex subunit epsilon [Candidatus Bathyarchaeota archaeon]|nr:CO dehydrogenase/acetyl-CoA synthase complex subunit epsilon [Candidatus Bathyarchaeota archaeon]
MCAAEPWQKAEISGPMKSFVIQKPDVAAALIKKAKHPVLIVGHEAVEAENDINFIDYIVKIAKAGKIPIIASGKSFSEIRKFTSALLMPIVEAANRLIDPNWSGADGLGHHDLALFIAIPYYVEWLILSGIKHFSSVKTISLDRFYQPHASWSFPNLTVKDWVKNLNDLIKALEEGLKNVDV